MFVKHNKLIFNLNITTIDYFNSWRTKYTYVYLFKLYSVLLRTLLNLYIRCSVSMICFIQNTPTVCLPWFSFQYNFENWMRKSVLIRFETNLMLLKDECLRIECFFGLIQIDWEKNKEETMCYSVWENSVMCLNVISINTWIRTRVAEIMFIL